MLRQISTFLEKAGRLVDTYVEGKGHSGVGEEDQQTDPVQSVERLESLDEGENDEVDDCANGGVVVQRDDRVHLESVEEDLDHDQSRGLEGDSGTLAEESEWLKVDLAVSG